MKKKAILATAMATVTLATAFMFACGKKETVYDAGEYGTANSDHHVTPNAGYRFIGWSDPVKDGNKTVYKAQYEYREYYLSVVKDVYVFEQGQSECEATVKYKTTNMQTGEVDYEVDGQVLTGVLRITCPTAAGIGTAGGGSIIIPPQSKEYDHMVTATIKDGDYNINQQFTLHCVMNRIPAESIEIYTLRNSHEVKLGSFLYFYSTVLPENTSFNYCDYKVVRVARGGVDLTEEEAPKVGYFQNNAGLRLGDDAQVGDELWVQAENGRDPEIKSNLWAVTIVQ